MTNPSVPIPIGMPGYVRRYANYVPVYIAVHVTDAYGDEVYCLSDTLNPTFVGLEQVTVGIWIKMSEFVRREDIP